MPTAQPARAPGANAAPKAAAAKPAKAVPNPGIEPGDHVYAQGDRGPVAVRVKATGQHGFTAECGAGRRHKVPYDRYIGHKARVVAKWKVEDRGVDGSIVRDHTGRRRFIAGEVPEGDKPGEMTRPGATGPESPAEKPDQAMGSREASSKPVEDDPLTGGLDRLKKALDLSEEHDGAARDVLRQLFIKGPTWDGDITSKSGRDELFAAKLAAYDDGWTFLTPDGVKAAMAAGFDREKEQRDMSKALILPAIPVGRILFMKAAPAEKKGARKPPGKTQSPKGGRDSGSAAAGGGRKDAPAAPMKHGDIIRFRHGDVEGKGEIVGSGEDGVTVRDDAGREHQVRHDALIGKHPDCDNPDQRDRKMIKGLVLFMKANPNHGGDGRFASGAGGGKKPPKHVPADLTPGAIGFLGHHPSKPDRMAMISPTGEPQAWFGRDDTVESVAAHLRERGHDVNEKGHLMAMAKPR